MPLFSSGTITFFDHNYRVVVYDREASRRFYEHSEIHNGYHVDHGHFVAEGWGREHVAAMTHHEVVVRPVHEIRVSEEHHNIEARRAEHPEIVRAAEHGRPGAEHPGMGAPGHPGGAEHPGMSDTRTSRCDAARAASRRTSRHGDSRTPRHNR